MAENTKIEWCDHTVNFWWGCTKVSPGCANCYADSLASRFGKDIWGKGKPREEHLKNAKKEAFKYQRQAVKEGRRLRIFSQSMSDWLDPEVPIEWLLEMLDTVRQTPDLDWLLLSKRPELFKSRLASLAEHLFCIEEDTDLFEWIHNWVVCADAPRNVWIGTSAEDQDRADERIPELLQIPARVHFLSCEPLLGLLNLKWIDVPGDDSATLYPLAGKVACEGMNEPCPLQHGGIDWVICGGESGTGARPMHPDWARSLRDQCVTAEVPFLFKQWGEYLEFEHESETRKTPVGSERAKYAEAMGPNPTWLTFSGQRYDSASNIGEEPARLLHRVGKKAAGRRLDGAEWNQFPKSL